jgi:hypothetical protein
MEGDAVPGSYGEVSPNPSVVRRRDVDRGFGPCRRKALSDLGSPLPLVFFQKEGSSWRDAWIFQQRRFRQISAITYSRNSLLHLK